MSAHSVTVMSVWDEQSVWSQAANKLKATLFRARKAALGLTVAAAVLATLSTQIGPGLPAAGRVLAAGAAVCLGLIAMLQGYTGRTRVEAWTRARSVAEALKSETYIYLAGVAPYAGDDRDVVLRRRADDVIDSARDLDGATVGITANTRTPPDVVDVDSYITHRVSQQITAYYRPQSTAMAAHAKTFRQAQMALSIVALLLSTGAAVFGNTLFAGWSPVLATVIAAVAAHAAAARYDALALEYSRTFKQLECLLTARDAEPSHHDDQFVVAAEQVISIQNEAWMARSVAAVEPPPEQPEGKM